MKDAVRMAGRSMIAPHVRNTLTVNGIVVSYVVVSLPCLLFGIWSRGVGQADDQGNAVSALLSGSVQVLPLLLVLVGVAWVLSELNARLRQQTPDLGWLSAAWFFALLLPPDISWLAAIASLVFALVFGLLAFGGLGMAPFHAAVVGLAILDMAGGDTGLTGGVGTLSPTLILFAGGLLLLAGQGSVGTLLAGAGGLLVAMLTGAWLAGDTLVWTAAAEQLVLGNFLFVLVFVAMDPACQALTRAGRWLAGFLFGVLVACLRLMDPTQPEGTFAAMLAVYLCTPLLDALVLKYYVWKRGRLDG